jgi:hypothetical protein
MAALRRAVAGATVVGGVRGEADDIAGRLLSLAEEP